ncbi:chloride channel protein [Rhizorhabdus wittichii]|uniref:Chloride channel protein n=1 Tax=Rhizorhabdus wittichii TaxID=160791 RepID=A0A975D326_9SPHN|nr:chloride channel protein [Rhizorhabdus wittichii]QTH22250.1 chloride channel protein [Rhizorhabdus wittichii]
MRRSLRSLLLSLALRQRRRLRESEAAFILLATIVGLAAGLLTNVQQALAHGLQQLFYGVTINRLSALGSIHHPWKLLALPIGGLLLILLSRLVRRRSRPLVDVVEANALHGGRIPPADNLVIAAQTIISNGAGASVGLEAAYAQVGGGVASMLGQWLKLRRGDLRTLVGAGAGAAVGAAFGAPLTGAFYAFEIVIGNYTPAAIAPVMGAALAAAFVTRALGVEPYLLVSSAERTVTSVDYLLFALLGLLCAGLGILVMRLVTSTERRVQGWKILDGWRPLVGGLILMPIALMSPQSLSAGHGALHLNLLLHPATTFLVVVLVLKIAASVISLSFGFRGGLFFASLFLGSLVGQIYAQLLALGPLGPMVDVTDAALVGMAALSVAIVGGPMTLSILVLETTRDFGLMGVVLTASLVSSAFTREMFGYSFSTWRLHLRGAGVRGPRDVGWALDLNAGRLMRRDWVPVQADMTIAEFRMRIPLGSTSRAVMVDADGHYGGIVPTAAAYRSDLDQATRIDALATLGDATLQPTSGIEAILDRFDAAGADELAVVDPEGRVVGVVTERYARRRYLEEAETVRREAFRED